MKSVPSDLLFTSQYLSDDIAIGILLMESEGGSENWTHDAEDDAIADIAEGADWLCEQSENRDVRLTFTYDIHRSVPTPYEPINGNPMPKPLVACCLGIAWEFDWMASAMIHLGYNPLGGWESIYGYARDLIVILPRFG